ncbi:MAG: hypothetical protein ACYCW6_27900, partial [Candidatus Xenobia bacterium]
MAHRELPDIRDNPYPVYEQLLEQSAWHDNPYSGGGIVVRHAECVGVLKDPRLSARRWPERLPGVSEAE